MKNSFKKSNVDAAELRHTNEERLDYVQAIVDKLDLNEKVVFMGHSRGSENALRLAARNKQNCVGLILVNPMGFRANRGVQPLFVIHLCTYLWSLGTVAKVSQTHYFFVWKGYICVKATAAKDSGTGKDVAYALGR